MKIRFLMAIYLFAEMFSGFVEAALRLAIFPIAYNNKGQWQFAIPLFTSLAAWGQRRAILLLLQSGITKNCSGSTLEPNHSKDKTE